MNQNINQPVTRGAHHVGLTVPNLDTTRKFFINILNFKLVGEIPDYPAVFVSDGSVMITLWQVSDPAAAKPFNFKSVVGLHHLALSVESDAQLDALYERLSATEGVAIEFRPEALGDGPARHMICFIPGGIRMEFISTNG